MESAPARGARQEQPHKRSKGDPPGPLEDGSDTVPARKLTCDASIVSIRLPDGVDHRRQIDDVVPEPDNHAAQREQRRTEYQKERQ